MFEEPETVAKWTDECYWVKLCYMICIDAVSVTIVDTMIVAGKWVCSACESELGGSPAEDTQDGLSSVTDTNTGELGQCSFIMLSIGIY